MKPQLATLLRLALFQAAWWSTARLARAGHDVVAVLPQLVLGARAGTQTRARRGMLLLALAGAGVGVVVDGSLRFAGALQFPVALYGLPTPPFMIALWMAFAVALPTSLSWLLRPWWLGVVVGGVAGALAYRGGEGLGLLALAPSATSLLAVGVAWALATPALIAVARRCVPSAVTTSKAQSRA